jgi:hypothetical protein
LSLRASPKNVLFDPTGGRIRGSLTPSRLAADAQSLSDRDDRRHPARSIVKDRLSVGAAALYHARSGFFKARLEAPDGDGPANPLPRGGPACPPCTDARKSWRQSHRKPTKFESITEVLKR